MRTRKKIRLAALNVLGHADVDIPDILEANLICIFLRLGRVFLPAWPPSSRNCKSFASIVDA